MSEFRLTSEIIARSTSKVWDQAKREWRLIEVYESDTPETCLCGHFPIIEICVLKNSTTNTVVDVGNCCVKKFIGINSPLIFEGLKRVQKDVTAALNEAAIDYAVDRKWINSWEEGFLRDTMRKRSLTGSQIATRTKINTKVITNFKFNKGRGRP